MPRSWVLTPTGPQSCLAILVSHKLAPPNDCGSKLPTLLFSKPLPLLKSITEKMRWLVHPELFRPPTDPEARVTVPSFSWCLDLPPCLEASPWPASPPANPSTGFLHVFPSVQTLSSPHILLFPRSCLLALLLAAKPLEGFTQSHRLLFLTSHSLLYVLQTGFCPPPPPENALVPTKPRRPFCVLFAS